MRRTEDSGAYCDFHVDNELFGQSRVDEFHEKIRCTGLRHQTAERIEQAVGNEVGIFGCEDDGEQFLLETECRHAEHNGHEQTFTIAARNTSR